MTRPLSTNERITAQSRIRSTLPLQPDWIVRVMERLCDPSVTEVAKAQAAWLSASARHGAGGVQARMPGSR